MLPPLTSTLVIIEDETVIREMLATMIRRRIPELEVTATFGSAKEGLAYCREKKPGVVLLDVNLPDGDGIEVARELLADDPEFRILILTAMPQDLVPSRLSDLGIQGFIDKTQPVEVLVKAIKTVMAGGMFFASRLPTRPRPRPGGSAPPMLGPSVKLLSRREAEVARAVVQGCSSKEIANRLKLSVRTVEKHRANAMQKLGVGELASFVRVCIQAGLV